MDNTKRYKQVFCKILDLDISFDEKAIKRNETQNWDSVGHISLISELENEFDVMFEMDDILNFRTYEYGLEALKKHGVKFE